MKESANMFQCIYLFCFVVFLIHIPGAYPRHTESQFLQRGGRIYIFLISSPSDSDTVPDQHQTLKAVTKSDICTLFWSWTLPPLGPHVHIHIIMPLTPQPAFLPNTILVLKPDMQKI